MKKVLRLIVGFIGLLFLSMGLRWLLAPAGIAAELGMPLLDGVGRSTQIGDLSAFFITLGLCVLIALSTRNSQWYYPAILLLGLTAFGRMIAWLIHDAALPLQIIAPEIIFSVILLIAARVLKESVVSKP
ncbi:hypothetical protein [Zhongshania arctica]|uniref:DUF4345 domain-containing protein n=1 Tax=Zhongshania arctica TaxID=3238302 RepID=A0ABV3TY79_9GAMM|tara:strand:+ start:2523 stop:2912 length:390 start_codon:yes stop_codon:yes gene_type:complete